MIIREFQPEDAFDISLRRLDAEDLQGADIGALAHLFWGVSQIRQTITTDDGLIVACGGVFVDAHGQGYAWILSSDFVSKYAKTFHRTVKNWLHSAFDGFGCVRVQTLVYKKNKRSCRWLERLGMVREGLCKKCGHNALDRYIYARVSE